MKVAILGASISAQTTNHITGEVTGYSEALHRDYSDPLNITAFRRLSYSGNRVSDGGMIRATELAAFAPDIRIFEPNVEDGSRGEDATRDEVLFVYDAIYRCGARPITLMLPDDTLDPTTRPFYDFHRKICTELQIPMIHVNLRGTDTTGLLYGVHTTPKGALLYAELIAKGIKDIIGSSDFFTSPVPRLEPLTKVGRISALIGDDVRLMRLRVTARDWSAAAKVRAVQYQLIGQHSPVVQIEVENTRTRKSVWDIFCHFERLSFVTLFSMDFQRDSTVSLEIVDDDPNYEACLRQGIVWPQPSERILKPRGDIFIISTHDVQAELL